jgi:hypothetical protein
VAGQPNLAGGVVRKDRCDTPILGTGQLRLLITIVIGVRCGVEVPPSRPLTQGGKYVIYG